jgi:hypothetical protein
MSGTFMDGGSGGDSGGSFFDGSGQDSGPSHGHSGYNHGHQGGDGTALGNILSSTSHNQTGFLAHLLGLDHDGGAAAHGIQSPGHVSQGAIWSSALQSVKFSDFTHGLEFTPAMGMACLYAGFIISLFVLYGIRHNEPLANAILGTAPASQGPEAYTNTADRRLVNGMRAAQGIRIASFPDAPKPEEKPAPAPGFFNFLPPAADTHLPEPTSSEEPSVAPYGSPQASDGQDISSTQQFMGPGASIAAPASSLSAPLESYTLPSAGVPSAIAVQASPGNLAKYAISTVHGPNGRKLKFIVNN